MATKQGDITKNFMTLKPSAAVEAIEACFRAGEVPMLHGDPGIGKTAIFGQVAYNLFADSDAADSGDDSRSGDDASYFRKFILSQREPTDALGLPHIKNGETQWAWPSLFPKDGSGVFFMDEFPQAVPMLQAPARQLLTERRFGPHQLAKGWVVGAAGNYPHNRAGANKLLTHVGSAVIHLHLVPDVDDWIKWASLAGKRPEVTAFIKFRPNLLHDFSAETNTFPCPRTWAKLSNLLDAEPSGEVEHALYAGCVGDGGATEFIAFQKVFKTLPDINAIIANPRKAPVPREDNVGTLYALAAALSRKADAKNFANIIEYCERMPVEFNVFCVRDAIRRDGDKLAGVKRMIDWTLDHQDIVL